jgi:Fibronectin type III domain
VPEQRIADTRFGTGGVPAVPLVAGGSITVTATGIAGIPATGVSSVAESVAALSPTANGYLSVYPAGTPDPLDPGVNFNSGDSQDNDMSAPVLTQVSGAGQETITNHSSGTVDIVVSARGYYAAASAPDAPGQVDAGLQSGTATVTWAAPDTDGGAAITSYALTLHNPDGSVNRVASAEPDATSWTATGLGAGTYSVSVAAVNSAGTSEAATATVNTVPSGWAAPNTENLTTDENITIDLATGNLSFDDGTATEETFAPDGSSTSVSSTPLASTDIGPDSGAYTDDGTFTDP